MSVTRLARFREAQAPGAGHFASVARELGQAADGGPFDDPRAYQLDEERYEAEQAARKVRTESLTERLRQARLRLGISQPPPAEALPPKRG